MGNCATLCSGDDDDPELSETISENDREAGNTLVGDPKQPESKESTPANDDSKTNQSKDNNNNNQSPSKDKKKRKSKWEWVEDSHVVKDVYQLFAIEKELGRGASCRVVKVHEKSTGKKFAMKEMRRDDKWNPMLFEQECYILKKLSGHPNILHYEDCYVDSKNFYVLTALCVGGELFDKIKELRHFRERPAADVMRVIIDAMRHCHEKNIVHRDLKPENIVFKDKEQEQLVIIDFGDAKEVEEHSQHDDFVGTAFYLAPEAIKTREGWELKKSDMWTIGVIAYVLVTGRPPFWGRENKEIIRKIVRSQVRFPSTIKLSESCKDFILSLLKKNPADRLSAAQALEHPWITNEKFKGNAMSEESSVGEEVLQNLATFGTANKLKQLIVKTVAANLDKKHRKEYESQFLMLSNDNETLNWEALSLFLKSKGIDHETAEKRAKYVVKHISGSHTVPIVKDDWNHSNVAKLLSAEKLIERQFRKLDVDEDGVISCDDLMSIFEGASRKEIMSIIDEVDMDQDGLINFEEFRRAMHFKPAYKK